MILITARPYELPLTVAMQLPSMLRAKGLKGNQNHILVTIWPPVLEHLSQVFKRMPRGSSPVRLPILCATKNFQEQFEI